MKDENMKDKHQRVLQVDTIILGLCGQTYPSDLKFAIYLQYLKNEINDAVDFLDVNKHLNFHKHTN